MKSLKDVIDFNERNKDREMTLFGQELFVKAESKGHWRRNPISMH